MEVVVELLLEVFGEVLLGAVGSVFNKELPATPATRLYRLLGYAVLGGLFGGASLWLSPTHRLRSEELRLAWLVAAPLVGAFSMSVTTGLLKRQSGLLRPWPMLYGATLVGVSNAVRFVALG